MFYMSEDSVNPLSDVTLLDNDFDRMHFESTSSNEEIPDDSNVWSEMESDFDGEFLEDHGIIEHVMPTPENNTINPIDYCRHCIIFH